MHGGARLNGPIPVVAGTILAAVALTGCGPASGDQVVAAPQAGTPACAAALAAAPATVLGRPRSPLPVPGTVAWGEPPIVVRCGLPEQRPTTKRCLSVDDVDWVVDDVGDPLVFTAYGRAPTVEVRVPRALGEQQAPAALAVLAPVARAVPTTARACVG
ncbi:MAG TPA: DUF3515 family protein [Kineosporiaceae bacterium]